ncbi:MAG: DUF262 domain-containing protein [Planctomycetota bacterium]
MIKSVVDYPLSVLFDNDSKIVYQIPRYQRPYTWNKKHWEQLFDDILESDPGYFLGSIICINQSEDSHAIQPLELIDGQQRMTTLAILLASIYYVLGEFKESFDEEQTVERFNLKKRLVLKGTQDALRVVPQIHKSNQDDFRSLMAAYELTREVAPLPNSGNRRIWKAASYFERRLEELCPENGNAAACKELFRLLEKIYGTVIVKIEVASHSDAYTLFESLNNRGEKLTGVDLIKNKMLASLEQSDPGRIDHHFDEWNKLLSHLGDDANVQERFFRHFYNGFRNDLKTVVNVPVATRSNLIQIYEKLINYDAQDCLAQLGVSARQYSLLLADGKVEPSRGLECAFQNLVRVQGAPGYLLVLHLLVRKTELELDASLLTQIVLLLVRFFARRNVTDLPPTRDLTRLFMDIVGELDTRHVKGKEVEVLIRKEIVAASASIEFFLEKLKGHVYEEIVNASWFILCSLAEEGMTKETWVDLWTMDGKHFVWTIEHILPQGEKLPKDWVMMIADGDKELAADYQASYVHTLGNLTLSGFNSSLSNKSFEDKRDRTDRKGRFVGYKNNLNLNRELAKADRWTVKQIQARTQCLAEDAMKLFALDR